MMRRVWVLAPLLVALMYPVCAFAQLGLPGIGDTVTIELSPDFPSPGQGVQLTLESSNVDLTESQIVWSSNGTVIAQGQGVTQANVTAGALGTQTSVEADVTAPDGTTISATTTIAPTELDLLAESDSYVPPFYRGRALPSTGSNLFLQAVARFERPDGTFVPESQIVYTWKLDGEVQGNLSGAGRSLANIPVTHLFSTDQVSVEAVTTDGTLGAQAQISLTPSNVDLELYEDHPLYGILYNSALSGTDSIPDAEMTFAAIPYFAPVTGPNDPHLSYVWQVDGQAITPDSAAESEITINGSNSTGQAAIDLSVTHSSDLYLNMNGSWQITLASQSSATSQFGQ